MTKNFIVEIESAPTVEIDTEASAAYIRISKGVVVRTEPYGSDQALVMIDFGAAGEVLGFEIIGQHDFTIRELIKKVPARASEASLNATRYIAAELQAA